MVSVDLSLIPKLLLRNFSMVPIDHETPRTSCLNCGEPARYGHDSYQRCNTCWNWFTNFTNTTGRHCSGERPEQLWRKGAVMVLEDCKNPACLALEPVNSMERRRDGGGRGRIDSATVVTSTS